MNFGLLHYFILGANHLLLTMAAIDSKQVVNCIVESVQLVARRKVALEFEQDSQDFATEILQKVNVPVVLNVVEQRNLTEIEHRTSVDVLVLLRDAETGKILNDTLWNGDTRFLIVTEDVQTIEKHFESFWKFKVINVFGLVMTTGNVSLFSFLPYGKNNCTKTELIVVDICFNGKLRNGGSALTDAMRIKNMNQCPINITVSEVKPDLIFEPEKGWKNSTKAGGFEGKLMMEVAKVLNFNATFKTAEDGIGWGWVHPSPRGAIGDLYRGLTDITLGVQAPFMERYEYFDMSANYNVEECITFAVPQGHGAKRAEWLTMFVLEFTFPTWSLFFFSFFTITINLWLINRYLNANLFKGGAEIAIFLFSSCVGNPIKTPNLMSGKTSAIFWIVFTFIITVAYKASMGSKLAVPPRDPDINTFRELLDSDVQLMGLKNQIQMLVSSDDWPYTEIRKRYKYTNESVEVIIQRLANREKVTFLFPKNTFYYYSSMNPIARGRVHVIKDCVYHYHPHALLKKFSPFTRRVSQIVRRLEESGIMEMWRAEFVKKMAPPKKPIFKLSIDQMFGVFCFLLMGYVVALFSFLSELIVVFGIRKPCSVFRSII